MKRILGSYFIWWFGIFLLYMFALFNFFRIFWLFIKWSAITIHVFGGSFICSNELLAHLIIDFMHSNEPNWKSLHLISGCRCVELIYAHWWKHKPSTFAGCVARKHQCVALKLSCMLVHYGPANVFNLTSAEGGASAAPKGTGPPGVPCF